MADYLPFKLEIRLKKLSIIVIATKVWGSSFIIEKIKDFIEDNYDLCGYLCTKKKFNKITDQVLEQLEHIYLPEKVLVEIRDVVRSMAEKVFSGYKRVIFDLNFKVKNVGKLSWTCYGIVDEAKTFQLYCQNHPELHPCTERISDKDFKNSLYSSACILGQEAFVSEKFSSMKKILKRYCGSKMEIPEKIDKHSLMSMWICCYFGENAEDGCRIYKDLDDPDARLLSMCARKGFFYGFKYFADNLKKGRSEHFFRVAEETLENLNRQTFLENMNRPVFLENLNRQTSRDKDNYVEILIFLIVNMSEERRVLFLKENLHNLFSEVIVVWPYQELILELIYYNYTFMEEDNYKKLLMAVLLYLSDRFLGYRPPAVLNLTHQVLRKLLESASKKVKMNIFNDKCWFLDNFASLSDFRVLKILLEDPYIITLRDDVIKIAVNHFVYEARKGKFQRLNNFINEILNEDEEKKKIKSNFNFLTEFVAVGNFELADKLIDWLVDSNDEKVQLKRGVDLTPILNSFYKEKTFPVPAAKKLLNWKFDGDEERIRTAIRNEICIREEFFKIWCGHCLSSVEASKTKCSEFLNLFFESDEIESFKRDVVIEDENFIELFCNNLPLAKNFECVDELLKFCCVPLEKVKELKRRLVNDIERLVQIFAFLKREFIMVDAIMNWAFEGEEDRKRVIGKFMNSPKGGELCWQVYKFSHKNFYENLLLLLNVWVPFGNIQKIMKDCLSFAPCNSRIKTLFGILKEKDYISKHDLKKIL